MEYFKKEELIRCYRERKCDRCPECRLQQAVRSMPNGIDENIESLVEQVLAPARRKYGKPMFVNSGFRCPLHNGSVGGASQSQHVKGEAADVTTGSPAENLKLAKIIVANGRWDQMVLYVNSAGSLEPRFVHVSWKRNGFNRREVLKSVRSDRVKYRKVDVNELK